MHVPLLGQGVVEVSSGSTGVKWHPVVRLLGLAVQRLTAASAGHEKSLKLFSIKNSYLRKAKQSTATEKNAHDIMPYT